MSETMDFSRQRLADFLAARLRASRTEKKERQDPAQDARPRGVIRQEENTVAARE
jgi:hypothetical protein